MQVIAHTASAALAPPPSMRAPSQAIENSTAITPDNAATILQIRPFEPPAKADAQSVVQAQIKEDGTEHAPSDDSARLAHEQRQEAAARTKSIMGLLPANPSQVTKLMSALAAATSAEAIADIKLEA